MMVSSGVLPVVVPAGHVSGPAQGCWTYEHYAAIPADGNRHEVIDGILYMTPAPNMSHQSAVTRLTRHLANGVEGAGLGRVFVSPTDVELAPGTIVQPDVIVILNANRSITTHSRVVGAPDLVIEVASPSTAGYDRRAKQDAYAQAGVREYWIADPQGRTVELLQLEGTAYRSLSVFEGEAQLPSSVVVDLPVHVGEFFE